MFTLWLDWRKEICLTLGMVLTMVVGIGLAEAKNNRIKKI